MEGHGRILDPVYAPSSLCTDCGVVFDRAENALLVCELGNELLHESTVHFAVDVLPEIPSAVHKDEGRKTLHHELHAIEASSLRNRHLSTKSLCKVINDYAISSREISQDSR